MPANNIHEFIPETELNSELTPPTPHWKHHPPFYKEDLKVGGMSAPAMNAVLPSGASAGPNPITPLSLTVNPVKTSPPPPVAPKPQTNHNAAISLVPESKLKTPEKPKETPAEPAKPISNGVDTSPVSKAEEPPAASASSGDLPAASSTDAGPAEVPATAAAQHPEPAVAPTPAPVEVASPPLTTEPAPPAPASEGTVASSKPDLVETATPPVPAEEAPPKVAEKVAEVPKPKASKAQGAKRRREPAAAEAKVEGSTPEKKPRRVRATVSPYQAPLPEITTVIKHSLREKAVNTPKATDEKLIVFYKNEFLAVRNAEGSFYLCQTMQNVYRTSHKIRIRWLSRDEKESTNDGGIYAADFYDATDFECILTSVSLQKQGKNKYKMPAIELDRVENILKRALDVEKGVSQKPDLTEEHPDGLDVSLYKDESQLQKTRKRAEKRKKSPTVKRSPKKVVAKTKKAKLSPVASGSRAAVTAAAAPTASTSKAKPAARKPPAKRTAPPPITPRKKFRTERNSARIEKEDDSPAVKASKKTAKVEKPAAKAKSPKTSKKAKKPENPAPKPVKKIEKVKSKTVVAVAAASSSARRAEKPKKPAVAAPASSDQRTTRKKGRK